MLVYSPTNLLLFLLVDASIIIFSAPIIVLIFACAFLKEQCGLYQSFVVILNTFGLCLTVKLPSLLEEGLVRQIWTVPSTSLNSTSETNYLNNTVNTIQDLNHPIYLSGVLEAFSSTLFAASVYIILRKARAAHYSVIMFNFGWVAIIETGLLTLVFGDYNMPETAKDWVLILLLMFFSFVGQILLTKSLQIEQAAPVAIVRSATDIILAFFWQIWLFNSTPDVWSISGALLVTLSIFLTSLRQWVLSLPQHSSLRHKFQIIR